MTLPAAPIAPRRSAAEEARTLVAASGAGTLATVSADGDPWASLVAYGLVEDGTPVLCVSLLAEHGRNLRGDSRASLLVAAAVAEDDDPLAAGRVTLAGRVERPTGALEQAARAAHEAAHPASAVYAGFGDFALWLLRVERVRWVGGYGRMDSATAADYAAAQPDPVAPHAGRAIAHLNEDHAGDLLLLAHVLGGHPDAVSATCTGIDRYGIDLAVGTPHGRGETRVGFASACTEATGLRAATVELVRRARAVGAAAAASPRVG